MKKTLKIVAILVGVFAVLIAATAIIAPMVINPNDYKAEIAKAVREQTGRELRIPGQIKLSVFPWLGVELGKVELGNAKGFGPKPFAQVTSADVKVRLLPLLHKRIELGTVSLNGLQLNLSRNAQGRTNWADLTGARGAGAKAAAPAKPSPTKPAAAPSASPLAALAIGGLDIRNASIVWDDRQHHQHVTIDHLQLDSGALVPGESFPLKLALDVDSSRPAVKGHLTLAGRLNLDPGDSRYRADDFSFGAQLTGSGLPGGRADVGLKAKTMAVNLKDQTLKTTGLSIDGPGVKLTGHVAGTHVLGKADLSGTLDARIGDGAELLKAVGASRAVPNPAALDGASLALPFRVSLGTQTAVIKPLHLQWNDLAVTADVAANHITRTPTVSGRLSTNSFSPRKLAKALKLKLPHTADPKVLTKASLSARFSASPQAGSLTDLKFVMDQSTLTGSASARDFAKPVVRFALALDHIDADRYLPPPAKGGGASRPTPATPGQAAAGATLKLPVKRLRALNLDGSLRIGQIRIAKLRASDIRLDAHGKDGRLSLSPLSAKMYQGRYSGNLGLDVRGATPRLSADETLSGVQIGPLLKDLSGKEHVLGAANVRARVHASGLDPMQIRKSLNGDARFSVHNATLKDVNIPYEVCKTYARLKRLPAPPAADKKTDFTNISASATIVNGVAHNKDLKADSDLLKVTGQGSANLVTERLNYDTNVVLVKSLKCTPQAQLTDLKFVDIPMHIGGSFASPSFSLDVDRALRAALKRKVQQKENELRQKAKEKLKQQLENKLKNLFGH